MAARNARNRKQPEKYAPSMKGNKYVVALTQIVASLKGSKHAMSMAQMSVKMMLNGEHRKADTKHDYGPAINEGSHQEVGPRS
jgi:hypothetical protein